MKYFRLLIVLLVFSVLSVSLYGQKCVEYSLHIQDTLVNYTGKVKKAMAINGQIPAPTLYFTEGDTAIIHIYNDMHHEETSLHWHGILLPNQFDGVPYLTSAPIKPGEVVTYKFPIIQNGTNWYHSHTGLQEQMGLYGAFVIHKRENDKDIRQFDKLPEHTVVLSDWTDMDAMEVNRKLHTANDWFAIRKGSVQSYGEAIRAGHLKAKIVSEWKRMNAMDVSDIYYERFLANGKKEIEIPYLKPGSRVRLRIVNGASSSYFWLRYAGGKITVIANDGKDVEPVEVDRMIIAVSETYDIVVTVPEDGSSAELQATAEDRTGFTSVWLGKGTKEVLSPLPRLNYFAGMKMMNNMMKMNGDITNMGMSMSLQKMDMNEVMYPEVSSIGHNSHKEGRKNDKHTAMDMQSSAKSQGHTHDQQMDHTLNMPTDEAMNMGAADQNSDNGIITLNYNMLRATQRTTLPEQPTRELRFELTGNMDRYVWTLDNKTVSESDKVMIKEGENLRVILYNNSMMRHPMHLHGHYFRVVNDHKDYSPLKYGVDIMPGETDTLEFHAGEQSRGDWFFHCHILYHMMSGMGRIFSYEDSPPNPQILDPEDAIKRVYADDRMYYLTARNDFMFSGNQGRAEYANTRWSIQGEWLLGYKDKRGYEFEGRIGRYIGKMQWLYPYIGVDWGYKKASSSEKNIFGQRFKHDHRIAATIGMRYTLPLLIIADARVDTYGKVRLQLEKEDMALTNRLRLNLMINTDKEWRVGLNYIILPYLGITAQYNSELKYGAGIRLIY